MPEKEPFEKPGAGEPRNRGRVRRPSVEAAGCRVQRPLGAECGGRVRRQLGAECGALCRGELGWEESLQELAPGDEAAGSWRRAGQHRRAWSKGGRPLAWRRRPRGAARQPLTYQDHSLSPLARGNQRSTVARSLEMGWCHEVGHHPESSEGMESGRCSRAVQVAKAGMWRRARTTGSGRGEAKSQGPMERTLRLFNSLNLRRRWSRIPQPKPRAALDPMSETAAQTSLTNDSSLVFMSLDAMASPISEVSPSAIFPAARNRTEMKRSKAGEVRGTGTSLWSGTDWAGGEAES